MKPPRALSWAQVPLTDESICGLAPQWRDLCENAVEANVFLFPWFVRAGVSLYAPGTIKLVTFYDNELLISLFLVADGFGVKKIPVPFLKSAIHDHQFLATPLVREGYLDAFSAALLQWLDEAPCGGQMLLLTHLSADTPICDAITARAAVEKRRILILSRSDRAALRKENRYPVSSRDFLSPARLKKNERKLNALRKRGSVRIEKYGPGDDAHAWLTDFLTLEHAGWKGEAGTSILSNSHEKRFYEALVDSIDAGGAIAFTRLTLDGTAIAYTLDLLAGDTAFCIKCAHDPAYRQYAPGIALEIDALDRFGSAPDIGLVDSCSQSGNTLMNEIWPHRKPLRSLAIERKSFAGAVCFSLLEFANDLSHRRAAQGRPGLQKSGGADIGGTIGA